MRLFVAVEVPGVVRDAVAAAVAPLRAAAPTLRWVAPERYHLTLVFLGSVPDDRVGDVAGAMASGCVGVRPFPLSLDGRLGSFGRRVLWAGLAPSLALAELAAAVRAALGRVVSVPDADRAFSAHLTLARAGREPVRSALLSEVAVPVLSWQVHRVALMRSAGGYEMVEAVDLAVADA